MTDPAFLVEEAYKTFGIKYALEHKQPCSCDGCLWLRMYRTYREEPKDESGVESLTITTYRIVCQYGSDDCKNCDDTISGYDSVSNATESAHYYGWSLIDGKWACPWCNGGNKYHVFQCSCKKCKERKSSK